MQIYGGCQSWPAQRPGNRGKRDSQILLLHYLNRVHFDALMYPLELENYHQMRNVIGVDPAFYEYIFTVDADTVRVHFISSMCLLSDRLGYSGYGRSVPVWHDTRRKIINAYPACGPPTARPRLQTDTGTLAIRFELLAMLIVERWLRCQPQPRYLPVGQKWSNKWPLK